MKTKNFFLNFYFSSKILNKTHAVCLGDSHINVFKYIADNELLDNYKFDVYPVLGATAQGMINPNSKTDALKIFTNKLKEVNLSQTIFLQLGEVDCGFVIWYYSEKYATSIDEQLIRSINNYTHFIEQVRADGFKNVIVISAPLPTIADNQNWGRVANLRREVRATRKNRTALTVKYNLLLSDYCSNKNITFLDTTEYLIDHDTDEIKKIFLNENPLDHHLNDREYAKIICNLLGGINRNRKNTRFSISVDV